MCSATGTGVWKWAVKFTAPDAKEELRDAVEAKINLRHPAPLIRQVETSRVEGDTAELLRITDPQIAEGSGEVTVSLTNTRVGELRESLRQLLHYPYGCVEQTTSSMLPWLTVRDLRATLPELAKSDEEIAKAVNGGIRLLLSMQTSGGGLSYWPRGREPMLWGSAYGGLALALAKKQGFTVPEAEYKRLLKYLSDATARDLGGLDRLRTLGSLPRGLHPRGRGRRRAGLSRSLEPKARQAQRGRSRAGRARRLGKQRTETAGRSVARRSGGR